MKTVLLMHFTPFLAITLCIEANVLYPDSEWQLQIARTLYRMQKFRQCLLCLDGCEGNGVP